MCFKKEETEKDHPKIYIADLDSPRRELSVRSLEFVVALLVRSEINFSCACAGEAIQLE